MSSRHLNLPATGLTALSLSLLCLLAACSGSGVSSPAFETASAPPVAATATLPDPAELLARGISADTPTSLVLNGAEYDAILPSQQVQPSGPDLEFSPSQAGGTGLSNSAFGFFQFIWDHEELNSKAVSLSWEAAAKPLPGTAWVGLINLKTARWDWQQVSVGGLAPLGPGHEWSDYLPADNGPSPVYCCVLLTGSQSASLRRARLGVNAAPLAAVRGGAIAGFVGQMLTIDMTASHDSDGSISSYELDFDSDGQFEKQGGEPFFTQQFNSSGVSTATLRVTDNEGASSSVQIPVRIGWESTFTHLPYYSTTLAVAPAPDGGVYSAGRLQIGNTAFHSYVMRFDHDGNITWALESQDENSEFDSLALDGNGNLYLTGGFSSTVLERDGVTVVKVSPEGQVLWSKARIHYGGIGGVARFYSSNIAVDPQGNPLIACLDDPDSSGSHNETYLFKLDSAGELLWQQGCYDKTDKNGSPLINLTPADLRIDADGYAYLACTRRNNGQFSTSEMGLCSFASDGTLTWAVGSSHPVDEGFVPAAMMLNGNKVTVSGRCERYANFQLSTETSVLASFDLAGNLTSAREYDFAPYVDATSIGLETISALKPDGAGGFWGGGGLLYQAAEAPHSLLLHWNAAGELSEALQVSDTTNAYFSSLTLARGSENQLFVGGNRLPGTLSFSGVELPEPQNKDLTFGPFEVQTFSLGGAFLDTPGPDFAAIQSLDAEDSGCFTYMLP